MSARTCSPVRRRSCAALAHANGTLAPALNSVDFLALERLRATTTAFFFGVPYLPGECTQVTPRSTRSVLVIDHGTIVNHISCEKKI